MSDPTQQHFLGCSIRNFNINIGWANQATTLSIGLVEDDSLYERFDGYIGQLVRFQYEDWMFDGILTNVKETKSESGNRLWEVVVSDPRELLSGVQMIISGYSGYTYNVPNLYNVYGYLESTGYGNSGINSAGIQWRTIRDTVMYLNQITPIYLAGVPYFIDLSLLPDIPNDYRISSTNISILDFIQEICTLANADFTVIMVGNYIIVYSVSRNIQQLNGSIYRFLNTLPQYVNMESGFELQYNTTNKFLVGGQVEQMYFQYDNSSGPSGLSFDTTAYDDTITRYWGKEQNGNVKIAVRTYSSGVVPALSTVSPYTVNEINETFYLDGQPISHPGRSWYNYPTDMDELRCAIESREAWETFLAGYRDRPGISPHISGSVHYRKYDRLKIPPDVKLEALQNPDTNIFNLKPLDLANLERNSFIASNNEQFLQKIYDYVANFAREHLDRKFMVRIPFVFAKYLEDGTINTSLEPTETGYIEESLLDDAVARNLLPSYSDFLLNEDNKLYCYVRFGPFRSVDLDLGELSEDDYYIENNYLFVKAEIDPEVVFINKQTAFSPRVIVTIPGRVKYNDESKNLNLLENEYVRNKPDITIPGRKETEKARASKEFQIWKKQVGADTFFINKSRYGMSPEMAAIPLKNNTETYGPWYTQGMQGIVEFIQEPDLVPWNFGGFREMNSSATAMVQDVFVNTMIGEAGSVEIPGSPLYQIATQISIGGPIITQISTSIGENGVTTTYRMEKWNRDYGREIRHRIDTYKRLHSLTRENDKKFAKLFKPERPIKVGKFGSSAVSAVSSRIARRNQPRTSHPVIMASIYDRADGKKDYSIGTMPLYQVQNVLDAEDWESIAGMSIDGLYVPYSTDPTTSGMPHFESPSGEYNGPTAEDLNPFTFGHNIGVAVNGTGVSGHKEITIPESGYNGVYRGIGLKGPLVLSAWGLDINGVPVPNGLTQVSGELPGSGVGVSGLINVSGDAYHPDYLTDITLWKTGPIDFRWDDNRKVWVAGSTVDPYIRDLRTRSVSGVTYFEYEQVSMGSGTWNTWFMSADCLTE